MAKSTVVMADESTLETARRDPRRILACVPASEPRIRDIEKLSCSGIANGSAEVKLLLDRAEEYYSDAVPYMKEL